MFSHNYQVFANSCVRPPLNGSTKLPKPSYLKPNAKQHPSDEINHPKKSSKKSKNMLKSPPFSLSIENNNFLSLRDFYDSIPDYSDVKNLPEEQFYSKIDTLKRRQDELRNTCFGEEYCRNIWNHFDDPTTTSVEPKISNVERKYDPNKYSQEFVLNMEASEKAWNSLKASTIGRKGSGKSVRINSGNVSPFLFSDEDNATREFRKSLRSKSASPSRGTPTLTVPKPFKMTKRDEEEKALEDLMIASKCLTPEKPTERLKSPKTKVNPIPITSKISLFKQIMEDKEHRSQLAKLDSAIELQSQIKPFGFDNGPERSNSRCLSRSLSTPQLNTSENLLLQTKPFKAKPCPKQLFSNYFYHKMWEDEYFRNMNKKIRAEELLKMSSLPPSMDKREKSTKKSENRSNSSHSSRKVRKRRRHRRKTSKSEANDETASNKASSTLQKPTPSPYGSSRQSGSSCSNRNTISRPLYPVNRPNLAATLRYEYSRKKLKKLQHMEPITLPSAKVTPFRWGVNKTPAWQALSYDPTHEEELRLRLEARKAEQKLRQEEYQMNKEMMIQRVRAAPLLLEGPTYWGPKVGQLSHHCTESELNSGNYNITSKSHRRAKSSCSRERDSCKLSDYSESCPSKVDFEEDVLSDPNDL